MHNTPTGHCKLAMFLYISIIISGKGVHDNDMILP